MTKNVNSARLIMKIRENLSQILSQYLFKKPSQKVENEIKKATDKALEYFSDKNLIEGFTTEVTKETWEALYPNIIIRNWVKLAKSLKLKSTVEKRSFIHYFFPYKETYEYELSLTQIKALYDDMNEWYLVDEEDEDAFEENSWRYEKIYIPVVPKITKHWELRRPHNYIVNVKIKLSAPIEMVHLNIVLKNDN